MYCINCGIELSKGQAVCPICQTRGVHPDFPPDPELYPYPAKPFPSEAYNRKGLMFVFTVIAILIMGMPLLLELLLSHHIVWSGYVAGGVFLGYIFFLLPLWFRNPNPVIFVPCDFAATALYLLYIDLKTGGGWFLSFAFPVTLMLGAIVTTLTVLFHYLRRGRLYIAGGGLIALGVFSVLLELFIWITFNPPHFLFWSLFPLIALGVLGMMLIIIAIVKPFKESLRKYFYM